MKYFSIEQLAVSAGLRPATVRKHHRLGLLKADEIEGVKGLRITEGNAQRWLDRQRPGRKLVSGSEVGA